MDMMMTVAAISAGILALSAILYARERRAARRLRVTEIRARVEGRLGYRDPLLQDTRETLRVLDLMKKGKQ
jgi:hypothetical protein